MPNSVLKTRKEQEKFRKDTTQVLNAVAFALGAEAVKIGNIIDPGEEFGKGRLKFSVTFEFPENKS